MAYQFSPIIQPTFIPFSPELPGKVQNSPTVVMIPAASTNLSFKTDYNKTFPKTAVTILGGFQLTLGSVSVITQIIGIVQNSVYGMAVIGSGIWCGLFFVLSGGFSIWAAYRPSKCTIITQMVFSIIAACFCLPQIVIAGIGVEYGGRTYRYNGRYTAKVMIAMYSIQIIASLLQAAIAVSYTHLTLPTNREV